MIELTIAQKIYLETEYPNIFKNSDALMYYFATGNKGALYQIVQFKNLTFNVWRCIDNKKIKEYRILNEELIEIMPKIA